jgi:hypothetical protein
VAPDNAFITFMGSGRRLSGTSLDVMDNVGCPYGTLGLEGKARRGYIDLTEFARDLLGLSRI